MQPARDGERQLSYISRSTAYAGVRRIERPRFAGARLATGWALEALQGETNPCP
jgi:hypothetical protein